MLWILVGGCIAGQTFIVAGEAVRGALLRRHGFRRLPRPASAPIGAGAASSVSMKRTGIIDRIGTGSWGFPLTVNERQVVIGGRRPIVVSIWEVTGVRRMGMWGYGFETPDGRLDGVVFWPMYRRRESLIDAFASCGWPVPNGAIRIQTGHP